MSKQRFISNSLALLANRLTQSITTFVLVAAIARILGAFELGQYTLAFSYYWLFMTFASAGLKTLFTRDLARQPELMSTYLLSGSLLQFTFAGFAYCLLGIVVALLPYEPATILDCWLMGLAIIPFSLSNITEAIFQAQERMDWIALSTVPIYLGRVGLAIALMQLGYGIAALAILLAVSEVVILGVQWLLLLPMVKLQWQVDRSFIRQAAKDAIVFVAIDGFAILKLRLQVIILSLIGGEVLVGIYGALGQLMQPFHIVTHSLVLAGFPRLSKTGDRQQQGAIAGDMVKLLLCVALPLLIGIRFVGTDLLLLVYQDPAFRQAGPAFTILALTLVAVAFTRPLSYTLVAKGHERINLTEVIVTACFGCLFSWLLVSQYDLLGAAWADVLMESLAAIVYIVSFWRLVKPLDLWRTVNFAMPLSGGMWLLFWLLQQFDVTLLPTLGMATSVYAVCMGIWLLQAYGGLEAVRARWAKFLAQRSVE